MIGIKVPKKICNYVGCNRLITMKERYCLEHKRDEVKRRNQSYDDSRRNEQHKKFYSSDSWRKLRLVVMNEAGGLCKYCLEKEMIVNANVIDHIIPIEIDYTRRLDITNLQPLCHSCHARKTADEKKLYGEGV